MKGFIKLRGGLRAYREEDCAVIYRTRERHGALSNMASGFPLQIGPTRVSSSEVYYQALRYPLHQEVQA